MICAITFSIVLLIFHVVIIVGFKKSLQVKISSEKELKFSVVIAVKNEEPNLSALLKSIDALDYGRENFEVIFIDDHSTDGSFQYLRKEAETRDNIKVIQQKSGISGKKRALALGIEHANFENIAVTDGDCVLPANWLRLHSSLINSGADAAFGASPYRWKSGVLNHYNCFENFKTHLLTFGFAELGMPYSAKAWSFSFKLAAFEQVGGFGGILHKQSGDDDLLIQKFRESGFKIIGAFDAKTAVLSDPPNSWKNYFMQKRRHTSTSHDYSFKLQLLLGIWHILNISAFASILAAPFYPQSVIPFCIKLLMDLITTFAFARKFGFNFNLMEIVFYQFLYEIFIIFNFFNSFSNNIQWKSDL